MSRPKHCPVYSSIKLPFLHAPPIQCREAGGTQAYAELPKTIVPLILTISSLAPREGKRSMRIYRFSAPSVTGQREIRRMLIIVG